ncbi:MAG TPA: DUF2027 domain-containing protein [Bacteroidia bacterium]|nr:DUF2027 domain-containing protein [Bacteroidia bacterium]
MKLRIGDKVRFLNEVGEGLVSRIKDKNTVFVEMEDGFEIPFPVKQLVPIHTELILEKDSENLDLDPEAKLNDSLFLMLEPDHELRSLMSDYRLYLYNASSYHLLFTYSLREGAHYQCIKHGEAGPYQKTLLKTFKPDFLKEYPYHRLDIVFYKNSHFKSQLPVSETVLINEQVLHQNQAIQHPEFEKPVYAFLLKDDFSTVQTIERELKPEDVERLNRLKERGWNAPVSKSNKAHLKNLEKEVDLHIEELVDSLNGLGKHEMLKIQMDRFHKELDQAIAKHLKKIVFIHGVGNGRLKQEILSILRHTPGISFHDASYKTYGFGATQVNIL